MGFTWNDEFMNEIEKRLAQNLENAAQFLENKIVDVVSVSGSGSDPGMPPHEKSGDLKDSIYHSSDGKTAIIGSDSEHAIPLEFGTTKMAPRPFLLPTYEAHKDEIAKILTDGS